MIVVPVVLTKQHHRVLALLHLLGHHPADIHQVLCDVTAGLSQILFGRLPEKIGWN